ncbi:MAG: flagellar basal body P-ring formation protein FlgA [Sulfurimonas sp.]|jgi:flagella basal body P-ring formation protein FlgA|nr:flagellar basal body P-ring formation protein FlgA [Sulfurimonas sp.]MBU3937909.1 flagellar basal body P-ring formation chaperone FlgA [bacterium]MBU4025322.1 flagellar basal body P-ring formation chaperone FlgA [bacterium]MBU4059338.1 flagellar basal body P-ring formation chaperone FlgA [bacterium]MBU4111177.1 flagellar basal body P-ring formation chaperone FlgA [bacterium]
MTLKILFLFLFSIKLIAGTELKNEYYVESEEIRLSSIFPATTNDALLFQITQGRYTKRVQAKELIALLDSYGYKDLESKNEYIQFTKQAPLDFKAIEEELKTLYRQRYKQIKIQSIEIHPRGYLDTLPQEYTLGMQSKSHLKRQGTFYIKTKQSKKIFFDFNINATIDVYFAREDIKRNTELSAINTIKKSIILDKFRAQPLQNVTSGTVQSKQNIKKNTLLTSRDIVELQLVRRGESVSVLLEKDNMSISFSAEALEDGVYEQIIEVQQQNGTKIKIKVTGKNRGEVI